MYLSIIFPRRMLRIGFISAYHPMHVTLTLTGAALWTVWSLELRSEGKQQLSYPNAIATCSEVTWPSPASMPTQLKPQEDYIVGINHHNG